MIQTQKDDADGILFVRVDSDFMDESKMFKNTVEIDNTNSVDGLITGCNPLYK